MYIVGELNVRLDRADESNSRQLIDLFNIFYGFAVRETDLTHVRGGVLDVVATRRDRTPPQVTVYHAVVSRTIIYFGGQYP